MKTYQVRVKNQFTKGDGWIVPFWVKSQDRGVISLDGDLVGRVKKEIVRNQGAQAKYIINKQSGGKKDYFSTSS